MKVEARVLDVTSTLEGEKVGMTIDEGALAHIMSVLTDLYSDPEMAVIREYSTNAFDAHVEAGVTRPIEVSTPSPLSMFFKVRDYGLGLNADDIRDIYSRYGASTKRETNEVVGMLGLGCKSALTYTDQFTVTGWRDGICTQVSVSRDEDGSGSMTIVAEYESNEPSGVEITVPVKRHHYFEEKTSEFYRVWKPGTVLVNGKEPKQISGMWLTDDLLMTEELENDVVVMGNVAYPFPTQNYSRYAIVAFVGIGEVNFTPSREALQMTKRTKETLESIKQRFKDEKDKAVQRNIDAAKTHVEALAVYLSATRMEYKGTPTYKGQPIPEQFVIETVKKTKKTDGTYSAVTTQEPFITVAARRHYGDKGWHRESKLYTGVFANGIFLVGYDGADFTPTKRKKLDQWVAEVGIDTSLAKTFVIVNEIPKKFLPWIDPSRIHNWEDVKAQKLVRPNQTRNGRPTGSYEGYVTGYYKDSIKAEDIDTSNPIFYVNKTVDYKYTDHKAILMAAQKGDWTYITLPGNRVAKFQRDFPMAVSVTDQITKLVNDWKNKLTPDQITLLVVGEDYYRRNDLGMLQMLDETRVDDPEVKAAILLAKTKIDNKMKEEYRNIFAGRLKLTAKWDSPLHKYALLTAGNLYARMNDKVKDELYIYLNAVYSAAGKAGN